VHNVSESSRSCRAFCAAACVLAFCSDAIAAAPDWIELSWSAADGCSSAADVLDSVDDQLGEQFVSQTRIRARGELHRQQGGEYELQLDYDTDAGAQDRRRIRGETCHAVTEAAALVLALAVDPTRVLSHEPTAPPPPAAVDAGENLELSAGVRALFDTAVTSLPTVGGGIRLGVRYGAFELSASAQVFLPREPTSDGIGMRLQYWSADIGACYLARVAAWSLGPCARFEMGMLSGEPQGELETAEGGSERVHVATLAAATRVPVFGAFQFEAEAGFEWVARRPQFDVEGAGTVASPALFGARVTAGALLAF
jgi:hypothetical protein